MWQPISTAPYERDLELSVMDKDEPLALVFPESSGSGRLDKCQTEKVDRRAPNPLARIGQKTLKRPTLQEIAMAKAKKHVARKSSKRGKASAKPARKKVAKRATPKKVKSKVRQPGRGALKSTAEKKRPPKTKAKKAPRKAPRKMVEVSVEDTIIDVIDEPVPGVLRVTEYEMVRTPTPEPDADSGTEEH